MKPMSIRLPQRAIFLLLPAFLAGVSFAQKVIIEYDHDIDFSAYRKYDWKEHPLLEESPGIQAVHCRRGTGPE